MDGYDLSKIPLGMPPPGHTLDLSGGPSQAWMPRLAIYTTLPVAFGFLALRLFARLRTRVPLGLDDYLCITAVAASGGFCGAMLSSVTDDMYGRHAWNLPLSHVNEGVLRKSCAITAAYCWASALIKLSLCLFFRRIFSPSLRSKVMIWVGIISVAVLYTAFFIAWVVCSTPHQGEGGWMGLSYFMRTNKQSPEISIGLGVVGTLTDFYIITIPLVAIVGLNMSLAKKLGVSALFATGLLACSFSAAGLASRFDNYLTSIVDNYPDPFWTSMPAYALAVAEINLGIVCACVPVSFPLFKGLAEKSSNSWDSWKQYRFRSRTPPKSDEGLTARTSNASEPHQALPSVPRGTLRTLLSFVRGPQDGRYGDKSQRTIQVTSDTVIEMRPYSGHHSVDFENMYHTHLYQQGSQKNLVSSHEPGRGI